MWTLQLAGGIAALCGCSRDGLPPTTCGHRFCFRPEFLPAARGLAARVLVTDHDGDGQPDLVAGDSLNTFALYHGLGGGAFADPVDLWQPMPCCRLSSPLAGDLDGRPGNEVVATCFAGTSQVAVERPATPTRPAAMACADWPGDEVLSALNFGLPVFALADVNGDGRLDLCAPAGGGVGVALGKGDGTFGETQVLAVPGTPTAITSGDFDGDRRADLAMVVDARVLLLLGRGNGTFEQRPLVESTMGIPKAIDIDGDGNLDLAVQRPQFLEPSVWLRGDGRGGLSRWVSPPAGFEQFSIAPADFDGDGWSDLVFFGGMLGRDGAVVGLGVVAGLGSGRYEPVADAIPCCGQADFTVADVDSDGDPDVVTVMSTGFGQDPPFMYPVVLFNER